MITVKILGKKLPISPVYSRTFENKIKTYPKNSFRKQTPVVQGQRKTNDDIRCRSLGSQLRRVVEFRETHPMDASKDLDVLKLDVFYRGIVDDYLNNALIHPHLTSGQASD